jgi:hypothetical protein
MQFHHGRVSAALYCDAMPDKTRITVDGNEAAASVAHRLSEVISIYPITPSSAMGELSDEWSAAGRRNLWGAIPQVIEMQSEGGAAGAATAHSRPERWRRPSRPLRVCSS